MDSRRPPALGSRGQGWVWIQFVVLGAVAVAAVLGPSWPSGARSLLAAGAGLALSGVALGVWAARTLGSSLTPHPRPREGATLVESGPFGYVRHPIYAAGLLFACGVSLATSPLALALTGLLGVVWALKLQVEERFLRERYPGYAGYAERVRSRVVPHVW